MGVWSASITGNDLAMDLRAEYTSAFYYYDIPEALDKIESYVRSDGINESIENDWCDYVYSLTDFMWRNGILTPDVLNRAIDMIDNNFGLEVWAEVGTSMLKSRVKALDKFRAKITSPQPPRKKIKPSVHVNDIFENGDLIAIKLQTANKHYCYSEVNPITDDFFHSLDGKYVLIQKIGCYISWTSKIVSEVKDHWPVFRLFDGIYDSIPETIDYSALQVVNLDVGWGPSISFSCEGSMHYFKRRKYQILGNYPVEPINVGTDLNFSVNCDRYNPDSELICNMSEKTLQAHK